MCADRDHPNGDPSEGDRDTAKEPAGGYDLDQGVQHALDRLTLLINATEALASTLDEETGLRRLCHTLVPGLADWCAVDLLDDRGRLRRVVVEHRDTPRVSPGQYEGPLPPAEGSAAAAAKALNSAGPLLVRTFAPPPDAADPLHSRELELFDRMAAQTAVLAPLRARRRVLGLITLVRTTDEAALDDDILPLVEDLAHRVALAVDNSRLRFAAQHTAERLQRSLLPDLPSSGPLEIAARYESAVETAQIGGDWYDAFVLANGATALIIGDVAGHDLRAAVTMSQMRNMLRGIACDRKEPPGKILARLDAAIHILYPDQTLTCVYALVEKPTSDEPWQLHYAVGGHPAPLLVTGDGETRFLEGGRSMMLGVETDEHRSAATEALPPDSTVLLYTDGLVERRDEVLDRGLLRLRQRAATLAREPLETFCDELLAGLAAARTDDVAMIAVRVAPPHGGPATATVV